MPNRVVEAETGSQARPARHPIPRKEREETVPMHAPAPPGGATALLPMPVRAARAVRQRRNTTAMSASPTRWRRILVIALFVAACGTNSNSGSPGAGGAASQAPAVSPPASLSGTLTVWAMGNEGVKLKDLAKKFENANPGVTVNVTPVDWGQAVSKLQTAIAGHQTPDVSQMGTDMMAQFASTGALEPVPANFQSSAFFESAWNTNVVDGTVYGVPWYVETRMLYYRTDIAKKAGITSAPTTWDDLMADAKAMQSKGGAKWGISLGTKNWQEWVPFLWSDGGDIMDQSGNFTLNSQQSVDSLTFYNSFFEQGLSPKSVPEGFDITPAFVSGTHPMFFSGPWHIGLLRDAGGKNFTSKYDIAPIPKKVSSTSFIGGGNLVVYKDSKNKDLAWKFVQFMTDPKTQVAWYQDVTDLPAVQAAWQDPALSGDQLVTKFGEQLKDTKAQPAIASWSEVSAALNGTLEKMTTGHLDPKAAADQMQQQAQKIGTGG
jgi:multiple sugar transport system substrate-binding protein